ncbi:uncharacterized protein AKAW2_51451A [Aspergillus luchuensis]|uniref:Uncharacterized protein n=1 Tax=Aspergillus kawachii TaxID=1069201 RepID=A0A7R7WEE3_ASPKA|nr:uncharacterized protein AKAW2_51451A [Aspergillus luchuensis]BCS01110.1 hypothetical protein AKAW2_51451A [Aspergillus luchuensis]
MDYEFDQPSTTWGKGGCDDDQGMGKVSVSTSDGLQGEAKTRMACYGGLLVVFGNSCYLACRSACSGSGIDRIFGVKLYYAGQDPLSLSGLSVEHLIWVRPGDSSLTFLTSDANHSAD